MNVRAMGSAVALVLAMACTTSGSQSRGTGGTAQAGGTQEPATAAGQPGGAAEQDPLMKPGPSVKGHASDQVVSGEIAEVTGSSLTIDTDLGATQVLEIAPETSITVGGAEATWAEVRQGQPVRASFNEVDGRDVAVAVEVGGPASLGSPSAEPSIPVPEPVSPPDPVGPPDASPSGGTGTGSSDVPSGDAPGSETQRRW
jgi:hypothetical protein